MLIFFSCAGLSPDAPAPARWQTYSGQERHAQGSGPDQLSCDATWSVVGEPATIACPDCTFAFSLTLTLDASQSGALAGCLPAPTDTTAIYALAADEAGETVLWVWTGATLEPFAAAEFDELSGNLTYFSGHTGYTYGAYYYTDYITGRARLH